MKISLKQPLLDHRGKPIKDLTGDDQTLEIIAYSALSTLSAQEQGLGRDDRLKRGRLAQRIVTAEGGIIDLKAEDITLIKQCIGACYGPWVVACTEDMLEPQEPPEYSVA